MDPDPGKDIEVDPDPEEGSKWIWIRPNVVNPVGSGSETLVLMIIYHRVIFCVGLLSTYIRTRACV